MADVYTFPALLEDLPDGSVLVRFPDLPEAVTYGRDRQDALASAVDCVREALRSRMRDNEGIPVPTAGVAHACPVAAPAEIAAKAAVYDAFQRGGLSRVALASKLQVDESEVRRILDPGHRTKLERLEQAAKALGGRLDVSFVPT